MKIIELIKQNPPRQGESIMAYSRRIAAIRGKGGARAIHNRVKSAQKKGEIDYIFYTLKPQINRQTLPERESLEERDDAIKWSYCGIEKRVTDVPEAEAQSGVDQSKWQAVKKTFNTWEVTGMNKAGVWGTFTNYQCKVEWKRKVADDSELVDRLIKSINKARIPKPKRVKTNKGGTCSILNLYDAHINKLPLEGEASVKANCKLFEAKFDEMLTLIQRDNPVQIVFPIGNDFFHVNGPSNGTKRGTPQDVIMHSHDAYVIGTAVLDRCIAKALQVAPVFVPVIKDNHAPDKTFYAGHALEMKYSKVKHFKINNSRQQRKYHRFGNAFFGFAHGNIAKRNIGNMGTHMSVDNKKEWSECKHFEFYLGDIHHKQEIQFLRTKDHKGLLVRFLRSISNTDDEWHCDEGYTGVPKTAEAFVWTRDNGLAVNYPINF